MLLLESCDKEFPDLAIEDLITSGGINKLEVYRRLNVQEVWFWHDRFSLYHLREETPVQFVQTCGKEPITRSELLPDLDMERAGGMRSASQPEGGSARNFGNACSSS